ncbi:hypothetical protein MXB_5702, partial [Myxobolus squamalis]
IILKISDCLTCSLASITAIIVVFSILKYSVKIVSIAECTVKPLISFSFGNPGKSISKKFNTKSENIVT